MDLIVMQYSLQKRTPKRLNTLNQVSYRQGRTTPAKFRNPIFSTTSPQVRYHSQADKKYEDKGVGCDLFENAYINKTIQFNAIQIENYQPPTLIPDKKVLKKKNGLIIFKPIPKEFQLKSLNQSPEKCTFINNTKSREQRLKKITDNQVRKSSLEKERWFSDRNCRILLNDLWSDSYFQ